MEWNIREATASDYRALRALFAEGEAFHRGHLPEIFRKPRGAAWSKRYVLGLIANKNANVFVAQVGDALVGLICVMCRTTPKLPIFVRRRYAVIDNVVVKEAFRRVGVGRALVEKAHAWATAQGASSVELNVWEFNQGAIEFYQMLGYETASRRMSRRLDDSELPST